MITEEETNRLRQVVCWIADVAVVISIAWFVVFSLATQITVTGQSMEPALQQGEVVLMNRLSYRLGSPKRCDIVVFEKEPGTYQIKRIIGLPGETVQITGGLVYIDGQALELPDGLNEAGLPGLAEYPILLGDDEYFLLGDNRAGSEDSRFANVGNVKKQQIRGKVWLRIQPLSRFGLIHS